MFWQVILLIREYLTKKLLRFRASSAAARRSIELSHRRVLVSNSLLKRLQQLNSSTSAAISSSSVQLRVFASGWWPDENDLFIAVYDPAAKRSARQRRGTDGPGAFQQIQRFRATFDSPESCVQTNRKDVQSVTLKGVPVGATEILVTDVSTWRAEPMASAIASKSRND